MKHKKSFVSIILVISVLALAFYYYYTTVHIGPVEPEHNMIQNGDFEQGEAGWTVNLPTVITTEDKYSGTYSAKVAANVDIHTKKPYDPNRDILQPNVDYYFRVRVKPINPENQGQFWIAILSSYMRLEGNNGVWTLYHYRSEDFGEVVYVKNLVRGWYEILGHFRFSNSTIEDYRYAAGNWAYLIIYVPWENGEGYYVDDIYLGTQSP